MTEIPLVFMSLTLCLLTGKKKPAPAKKAEAPAAEAPAAEPPKPADQPKKPRPQKSNKNAKKGAVKKALSAQKRVSVMLIISYWALSVAKYLSSTKLT